jgi:hypothetical protein
MNQPRICILTLDHGPADRSADARLAVLLAARGWNVHLQVSPDRTSTITPNRRKTGYRSG